MAIMEAMVPFLVAKAIWASVFVCICVLLCGSGRLERKCECRLLKFEIVLSGGEFSVRLHWPCCCLLSQDLTRTFSAGATLYRVAICSSLGLAWGFIVPHLFWGILIYLEMEYRCHHIARNHLKVAVDIDDDRNSHIPRYLLLVGVLISQCLMAGHIVSTAFEQPRKYHCFFALIWLVFLWLWAWRTYCSNQKAPAESAEHQDGIEMTVRL